MSVSSKSERAQDKSQVKGGAVPVVIGSNGATIKSRMKDLLVERIRFLSYPTAVIYQVDLIRAPLADSISAHESLHFPDYDPPPDC